MSTKEQTQAKDKASSKKRPPKPAPENADTLAAQQIHPTMIIQQARLAPGSLSPCGILQLQGIIGNRALTQRLARTEQGPVLQLKLMVGPVDDCFEQDADSVADHVLHKPSQEQGCRRQEIGVQRQVGEDKEENKASEKAIRPVRSDVPVIQMMKLPKRTHADIIRRMLKEKKMTLKHNDKLWFKNLIEMLREDFQVKPGNEKQVIKQLINDKAIDDGDIKELKRLMPIIRELIKEGKGLDDRHSTRAPTSSEDLKVWLTTLCKKRINELYIGEEHFEGHAQQIQLEINRLITARQNNQITTEEYNGAIKTIKTMLKETKPKDFGGQYLYKWGFGKSDKI